MNIAVQSGNLTRDPELMTTNSGLSICKFGVAVNQRKKVNEEWVDVVHFFDWAYFGRRGELMAEKAVKGDRVYCVGRSNFSQWETDEGAKRSKVDYVADEVEGEFNYRKAGETPARAAAPAGADSQTAFGAEGVDDDIPF